MQADLKILIKYLPLVCLISLASGQDIEVIRPTALDCLEEKIAAEIKKGIIEKNPLIIANGYPVSNMDEKELFNQFECSAFSEVSFISSKKAFENFDGEKARNGIVLITMKNKSGRKWIRKYKSLQ